MIASFLAGAVIGLLVGIVTGWAITGWGMFRLRDRFGSLDRVFDEFERQWRDKFGGRSDDG